MKKRSLAWVSVLAMTLFCGIAPSRASEVIGLDLVNGDPAAESIVVHLQALNSGATIQIIEKGLRTHPVTGYEYALLKVRVNEKDVTAVLNRSTGEFAPDPGLPDREALALLASLDTAYSKMTWDLVEQVRQAQGGILGSQESSETPIEVLFYAESAEGLDDIQNAIGGLPSARWDSAQSYQDDPPFIEDDDGVLTPVPPPPPVRAISATLPLELVLRVGSLEAVSHIESGALSTPCIDVSVPRVHGDTLKGYEVKGSGAHIAIVDTGIDRAHPNIAKVSARKDFTGAKCLCQGGPHPGSVCCGNGACQNGTCVGGPNPGQACVDCAPGSCIGPEDDRDGHGTHVSGIAASTLNAGHEGMAPLAKLINAKAVPGNSAMTRMALDFAHASGAEVVNGSFESPNSPSNGASAYALSADYQVFKNNRNLMIAASELGHSGRCSNAPNTACLTNNPNPCLPPGVCWAKATSPNDAFNVITVGASILTPVTSSWASFSQVGPTQPTAPGQDGRSKPDVLAPGASPGADGIDSLNAFWEGGGAANDYTDTSITGLSMEGTSMSSPHVAGLGAQLWGWGKDHGILTDTPYLKATIINNARRLAGWARPAQNMPLDTKQGAGEIDAEASFHSYADDLRVWQERVTGTTAQFSHWYWFDVTGSPPPQQPVQNCITDPGPCVVATLVWERHITNQMVVVPPALNDLDLVLWGPDGNLLTASVSTVDSVEHIVFPARKDGRYCIEVDPTNLTTDNAELYALALSRFPYGDPLDPGIVRDFRLNFMGTTNPCMADFGDAPDSPFVPAYPTTAASNGARHLDWTKEWLGTSRAAIDGELKKATPPALPTVHSFVAPFPSVSGENSARDADDQDGHDNLEDHDGYDDSVVVPNVAPDCPAEFKVTVACTVDDTGFGPLGRYDATVPTKRLYLNAWIDWNRNGDWGDPGDKVIDGYAIDPQTFGTNARYTIGEPYVDANNSHAWEPGESYTETAGATSKTFDFAVTPPGNLPQGSFFARFRLDYGENVGVLDNNSGNLDGFLGEAQFGEVEDYAITASPAVCCGPHFGADTATLVVEDVSVEDSCADSGGHTPDHLVNPGENARLRARLRNVSTCVFATNVTGTLATTSADVLVTDATAKYPDIAPGEVAEPVAGDGFSIVVAEAAACGADLHLVESASGATGQPVPSSLGISVIDDTRTTIWSDDFESDLGWTLATSGGATQGFWERASPQANDTQPGEDHTDPGTQCVITGAGNPQPSDANDVDGGSTTIVSPAIPLASAVDPILEYWRWFNGFELDQGDALVVEISFDDGASWMDLESVTQRRPSWAHARFHLAEFGTPTDQTRIRVTATDASLDSPLDAAFDDVLVTASQTPGCAVCHSPEGSCCGTDGGCENTAQAWCEGQQGTFTSGGTCGDTGACTFTNDTCVESSEECCTARNGTFDEGEACPEPGEDDCKVSFGLRETTLTGEDAFRELLSENPLFARTNGRGNRGFVSGAIKAVLGSDGTLTVTGSTGSDSITIRLKPGDSTRIEVADGLATPTHIDDFPRASVLAVHVDGQDASDTLVLDDVNWDVSSGPSFLIEEIEVVLGHTAGLSVDAVQNIVTQLATAQSLLSAADGIRQAAGAVAPLGSGNNLIGRQFRAASDAQNVILPASEALRDVHDGLVLPVKAAIQRGIDGPISDAGDMSANTYEWMVAPSFCSTGAVCDPHAVPLDYYTGKTFALKDLAELESKAAQGFAGDADEARLCVERDLGSKPGQGGAVFQEKLDELEDELDYVLTSLSCVEFPPLAPVDGDLLSGADRPTDRAVPASHRTDGGVNASSPSSSIEPTPGEALWNDPTCPTATDVTCCIGRTDIPNCLDRVDLIVSCIEKLADAFEAKAEQCEAQVESFSETTAEEFENEAEDTLEAEGQALEDRMDEFEESGDALDSQSEGFEAVEEAFANETEAALGAAGEAFENRGDALGASGESYGNAIESEVDGPTGMARGLVDLADDLTAQAETLIASTLSVLDSGFRKLGLPSSCKDIQTNTTIIGTPGPEILLGTSGDDLIKGNGGFDLIVGLGGNDKIYGGAGTDLILGCSGVNEIHGGKDIDLLIGGNDRDCLYGGDGVDLLVGRGGENEMHGGNKIDVLIGGPQKDVMHGDGGIDILVGLAGGNEMHGETCIDLLVGGNDDEEMHGDGGQKVTVGPVSLDLGNLIIGLGGADTMFGDADAASSKGVDVMFGGDGDDIMDGGDGGDLVVGSFTLGLGNVMFGGHGNDHMASKKGIDPMFGGPGDDTLCGGEGFTLEFSDGDFTLDLGDLLFGGPPGSGSETDNDTIYGDSCPASSASACGSDFPDLKQPCPGHPEQFGVDDHGINLIFGGVGNDVLFGGNGGLLHTESFELNIGNLIFAGSDNDTVTSGDGIDLLFGGFGNNTMSAGNGYKLSFDDGNVTLELGDFLFSRDGNDNLYGDAPADSDGTVDGIDVFFAGMGNDQLFGGNGGDLKVGSNVGITFGSFFFGMKGNDTLIAGYDLDGTETGIDFMFAGDGDDTLDGQDGGDITIGDPQNPTFKVKFGSLMIGGPGSDYLTSGDGFDLQFGGIGDDTMNGGSGIDLMLGGKDNDTMDGGDGGGFWIPIGGVSTKIPFGNIEFGGPGNDTVNSGGSVEPPPDPLPSSPSICLQIDVLFGGCGNDTMSGGDGLIDLMFANKGSDTMYGEEGIDLMIAGPGNDTMYGECGPGNLDCSTNDPYPVVDFLFAGRGDDLLYGACDPDLAKCIEPLGHVGLLFAGRGNDKVHTGDDGVGHPITDWFELLNLAFGGIGRDEITGSSAIDVVFAGPDCDRVNGKGNDLLRPIDLLFGGPEDDIVYGGGGILQVIFGGVGKDVLSGGCNPPSTTCNSGINLIFGNKDDDVILGSTNNLSVNLLFGNKDSDVIQGGGGLDLLFGGPGNDTLFGGALLGLMFGGVGSDVIHGGASIDAIFGGPDEDTLHGQGGIDLVFGGKESGLGDALFGDGGSDIVVGGTGDDRIDGGDDPDLLLGRAGADQMRGGSSNDLLLGGPDVDTMQGNADSATDFLFGGGGTDNLYKCETNDKRFGGGGGANKLDGCDVPMPQDAGYGVIVGTKWSDQNADSTRDVPLEDVDIYLDSPGPGQGTKEGCEPALNTSLCGNYMFRGLSEGTRTVREIVPPGFTQEGTDLSWPVTIGLASPIWLERDFLNRDDCRPNAAGTACSCACPAPFPTYGNRCTTDGSECESDSQCGCGGSCASRIVECSCAPVPPGLHTITGDVTCDNQFAIFTGPMEAAGMIVNDQGVTGCHPQAQSVSISTTDRYLYIAAWSDDGVAQGLLHDLTVDGLPVFSGNPRWSVAHTSFDVDACAPTPPADVATTMATFIPTVAGRWVPPAVGCANPSPGNLCYDVWGNFPSIDLTARRIWYDSGSQASPNKPFQPGFNHGEFLIFRLDMTCTCGPDGAPCDDGDVCTSGDVCHDGACTGGSPVDCNDNDPCTVDSCDPQAGVCRHVPVNCDDGNPCTADSCIPGSGVCRHIPIDCNDDNPCTIDSCDSTGHCVHEPGPPLEVDNGVRLDDTGPNMTIRWNVAPCATSSAVLRGQVDSLPVHPNDAAEVCLADNLPAATVTWTDNAVPSVGRAFWYLVRGDNAVGDGPLGYQMEGGVPTAPRESNSCP